MTASMFAQWTQRAIQNTQTGLEQVISVMRLVKDKTETILWHVRGQKRLYLYPETEEFISDRVYEMALTDYRVDDIPYKPEFEASAQIFDLDENQAITWPLNSPHRVDNRTFCVSVTTEYSTSESARKNSAMLTNATLRHRLGMEPSYRNDSPNTRHIKSIFGMALKKAGAIPTHFKKDLVTFKIDPSQDGYIVDTPPYERDF